MTVNPPGSQSRAPLPGRFRHPNTSVGGAGAKLLPLFRERSVLTVSVPHLMEQIAAVNPDDIVVLKAFFPDVRRFLYEDSLEVTRAEDMVDYICSLTGMSDLQKIPREEVRAVLERNMRDGVLHVPKEYGIFIAGA